MNNLEDSNSSLGNELDRIITEVEKLEDSGEPTNSTAVQDAVKKNISALEELTRTVSQLAMFSGNEDVNEIDANSLRFLLLPALLGYLTGKLLKDDRLQILQLEQAYYQDFLNRLRSYNIIKRNDDEEKDDPESSAKKSNVVDQSQSRQKKIERYKEQRNLQEKLKVLRERINNNSAVEEDLVRDLYLTELKIWAGKIVDGIETVQQEIQMCQHRENGKAGPTTSAASGSQTRAPPLKTFIITRTELQKTIYGLGYPAIPVVSLDQFFEQKREEWQAQADRAGTAERTGPITEEEEKIMREEQEDREQSEVVQHDREYDEYKDDHRRGWGSTYNKG